LGIVNLCRRNRRPPGSNASGLLDGVRKLQKTEVRARSANQL